MKVRKTIGHGFSTSPMNVLDLLTSNNNNNFVNSRDYWNEGLERFEFKGMNVLDLLTSNNNNNFVTSRDYWNEGLKKV